MKKIYLLRVMNDAGQTIMQNPAYENYSLAYKQKNTLEEVYKDANMTYTVYIEQFGLLEDEQE